VTTPAADLEGVCRATRAVLRTIADLDDARAAEPSRLPGWSRAEVVTHLARNGDAIRTMVEAARRDEVAPMYSSVEARAAGIAAGRGASADALRDDLANAHERLLDAWNGLSPEAWDRLGRASVMRTMREFVWVRRREVEVHHVDLGLGYEPSDWPVAFVGSALDEIIPSLPSRAANTRPMLDIDYRVVSTDHDRAWRVQLRGRDVSVVDDDGSQVDGEASGWGCDVAAWLYGRDPNGSGIVATGDLGVLRLARWFPYA
jgi:maleylpyruvate isomerase